ncbi:MAG: hypothetical protein LBH43_20200 [Treponema sp.]|nr:hypothetical protein [Treponema sp.]
MTITRTASKSASLAVMSGAAVRPSIWAAASKSVWWYTEPFFFHKKTLRFLLVLCIYEQVIVGPARVSNTIIGIKTSFVIAAP